MSINANFAHVQQRIQQAAQTWQRDSSNIQLLAVSKTQPVSAVQAAWVLGQRHFGENYLQDALNKIQALSEQDIIWHYIGAIQSNKTRPIAENFAWVETLASLKHAERLAKQRPPELPPLNVCLQVNISQDPNKSGIPANACLALAKAIKPLPQLRLRGLMTLPTQSDDFASQRQVFHALNTCFQQLNQQGFKLDTLSMGMTGDLEAAIAEAQPKYALAQLYSVRDKHQRTTHESTTRARFKLSRFKLHS